MVIHYAVTKLSSYRASRPHVHTTLHEVPVYVMIAYILQVQFNKNNVAQMSRDRSIHMIVT